MEIFPAIDIRGAKVVRLRQGDYDLETVYGEDPVATALSFVSGGAANLHIVDLDGARTGETRNFDIISKICKETGLFTQVGGGIRNLETAEKYLESGASRVILGTAAVRNEEFLKSAVSSLGERVVLSLDVRDGFVAVSGWRDVTEVSALEFCVRARSYGVRTVISTDISKDGMLEGPNFALYSELLKIGGLCVIASGGVSGLADIKELQRIGVHGVIIGKALYSGDMSLIEALKAAADN